MKKTTVPAYAAITPLHKSKKLYCISFDLCGRNELYREFFYSEKDFTYHWLSKEDANGEYKDLLRAVVCSEETPENRRTLKYLLENVRKMSITEMDVPTII